MRSDDAFPPLAYPIAVREQRYFGDRENENIEHFVGYGELTGGFDRRLRDHS